MTAQLDLFADADDTPDGEAADRAAAQAQQAAFDRLVPTLRVTAAEAQARGIHVARGEDGHYPTLVKVRACPACGTWEPNAWLIGNNHGIDPWRLDPDNPITFDGETPDRWCVMLSLTASHVANGISDVPNPRWGGQTLSDRQTRMLAGLTPDARVRFDQHVEQLRTRIAERGQS
jgi:hypothetical protein